MFVPADRPGLRAAAYGLMTAITAGTVGALLLLRPDPLLAAFAVLGGAVASYSVMAAVAVKKFNINFISRQLVIILAALAAGTGWLYLEPPLLWRAVIYTLLVLLIGREARRADLLPRFMKPQKISGPAIICFSGAFYDQPTWTNRQHISSRVSQKYPVFYVEPRVWILRYLVRNWRRPLTIAAYLKRLVWYSEVKTGNRGDAAGKLYLKSQWNLIPGSREYKLAARFNHWLNGWCVLLTARWLGFDQHNPDTKLTVWIYDTEAAQYLPSFTQAKVLYDCVDDHAAQAGPDRNPRRVKEEEQTILKRAELVTVTSRRLLELKKPYSNNVQLVLNAGDTRLFEEYGGKPAEELANLKKPVLGVVGALDGYKINFDLLAKAARAKPHWNFVLAGAPVVGSGRDLDRLTALPNVRVTGLVPREQAPSYVSAFDVCLIPYKKSRYNSASFPLKFWEFMVTGKPVVVTGLPELKNYAPLIGYAEEYEEFMRLCRYWLDKPGQKRKERVALAREHSWKRRTEKLLYKLENIL